MNLLNLKIHVGRLQIIVLWVLSWFLLRLSRGSSIEWNNSVSFDNPQFSIQSTYNTSSTDIILQKGYVAASGATYYAATAGTSTSVFSKVDSSSNPVWAKSYDPFTFYHAAFVVASDESAIYWIEEGASQVNILFINPTDGELVKRFVE